MLNSTAIFVSWTPPSVSNGIIIRYDLLYTTSTDCSNGTNVSIAAVPGQTDYNVTLTDLLPYTGYTLCVQASTEVGPGNFSSITVRTYPDISSPPTAFNVTSFNSTSISLTWGYPATPRGLIEGYLIMYNATGMEILKNITISTTDTGMQNYTIDGLTPYTVYNISVMAYSFLPGLSGPLYGEYSMLIGSTAQGCE